MSNLNNSLTAYYELETQKGTEVNAQLKQVQQHVATQLVAIQALEQAFVTEQQKILNQIQEHLARDARSLTSTTAFRAFVQSLFVDTEEELIVRYFATQIALDPAAWRLHRLKEPLQIHCVEPLCEELTDEAGYSHPLYTVGMKIQMGCWREVVNLSTEALSDNPAGLDSPPPAFSQWLELIQQLKGSLPQLSLGFGGKVGKRSASQKAAPSQRQLAQEIACVLVFVGELFHSYTVADRLWALLAMTNQTLQPTSLPTTTAK